MQHRLWEQRRSVVAWLENGAHFYVCGDAKAMAQDVHAALVARLRGRKALAQDAAENAVATLEREQRYLRDVY